MERIKIVLVTLIMSLLALPLVSGQDQKSEKRIKIVVANESGTIEEIDTVFTDNAVPDSIKLTDGKVIFIGPGGNGRSLIARSGKGHFVIVSPDDEDIRKEIIISSSDSLKWSVKPGEEEEGIIIYSDDRVIRGSGEKTIDVIVTNDDNDGDTEKSRFVIAKDGIVVSVEGNDEAKVKKIVDVIEKKLDINEEDTEGKTIVKETQTRTVKKK
jgi:Ethanolamine utilization protein EutJ (predicted chaperonin)